VDALPTNIELVVDAVHAVDRAKAKVEDAKKALAKAEAERADAEARLAAIVATGACTKENGCTHPHGSIVAPALPRITLEDKTVPIAWRIAFMLLENPVLDYQETARRLWGPLNPTTAKNRVNGHMTILRNRGVVETIGSNRFSVDAAKLAELSGRSTAEVANQ
jgi:hypothetical protein